MGKYGAFTLALSNLICSTAGIVLVPYAFVVIYNELHQFYEENNALEQFPVEIKSHVTILVLALVPLIGNLMSTGLLLYSLKTESSRLLPAWNWWLMTSFILFAALLIAVSVFQGFQLKALVVCLGFMIINLYLGFLVIIIRREIQQQNVNKSI